MIKFTRFKIKSEPLSAIRLIRRALKQVAKPIIEPRRKRGVMLIDVVIPRAEHKVKIIAVKSVGSN